MYFDSILIYIANLSQKTLPFPPTGNSHQVCIFLLQPDIKSCGTKTNGPMAPLSRGKRTKPRRFRRRPVKGEENHLFFGKVECYLRL